MRNDAVGFWWDDTPAPRAPKKEVAKRMPPARTWEADDYLPGLEEALAFNVQQFDRETLFDAYLKREPLLFDIECYQNFFQIAFMSFVTGKVIDFIQTEGFPLDVQSVEWVMTNFNIVGFNSYSYDVVMATLAMAGLTCAQLKEASDSLIVGEERPQDVLRRYKVKSRRDDFDSIDLIEVAPLRGSLKIYGGRLHVPKMQDLPFAPNRWLSGAQMAIVRWYCVNDLSTTAYLRAALNEQLKLREVLSEESGIDLRSRSDAQIAEHVIAQEIHRLNGEMPRKPTIAPGTVYAYNVPKYMNFRTPLMNWVLDRVRRTHFIVSEFGNIGMPPELAELEIRIADGVYRMGIGGLHSSESCVSHQAINGIELDDDDVESFYPWIILNQGLYPQHLGPNFLKVYRSIVDRRLAAKKRKDKVVSDSLKITINGSFGKLGSMHSVLYAPDLLIQVTISGQLSLLMLIERFELAGITVVSANTDGIVTKYPKHLAQTKKDIIAQWERETDFKTENTKYRAIYSRDVNNYIAIKPDGTAKTKGAFANPWATEKNKDERLKKNPVNQICIDAITGLLCDHIPINDTIRRCRDISKFITVRTVKGGAVKVWAEGRTEYLGKAIRWYQATGVTGELVYAKSGNKVPRSDGAMPMMNMPAQFPVDVNFDWYVAETEKLLAGIGYV